MTIMTWLDGAWFEGNRPILGPMTQATWLGGVAFDGARAFEGVTPDLDLHCERAVRSCRALGLNPVVPARQILELAREGIAKFAAGTALYIRPMFWAEEGLPVPVPESTRFALTFFDAPMPEPAGFSAGLSTCRRPAPNMAPTDAKVDVYERSIRPDELADADEIFSTGNYSKVIPVTRYEDRTLQPGPMFRLARELYWEFAHGGR